MNLNSTPLFEMLPKGAWGPSHLRVRTFAAPGLGKRRGNSLKVNAEAVTSPLPSDWIEHTGENIGASTTAVGDLPIGRKSPIFEGNRLKIRDFSNRKQGKSLDASVACQKAGAVTHTTRRDCRERGNLMVWGILFLRMESSHVRSSSRHSHAHAIVSP